MPHFGRMDETAMPEHEAALLRARLHLQSGRRRLRQGKLRAGIATMYDALYSAMRAYALDPANRQSLGGADRLEAAELYEALARAGAVDGVFDFAKLESLAEDAAAYAVPVYDLGYNPAWLIEGVESVMTQLGALPFDEATLPDELPGTF